MSSGARRVQDSRAAGGAPGGGPGGARRPHQRAVFALLLADANEAVSVERLIDRIWGERPPETRGNVVQGYVSQLRKRWTGARSSPAAAATRWSRRRRGRPGSLRAAAAAGRREPRPAGPAGAAAGSSAALALWRGPALSESPRCAPVRPIAARLDELRLAALGRRIERRPRLRARGRGGGRAGALVDEQPLRERPLGAQMLALYRSGRQAEALAAYRAARAAVESSGSSPARSCGARARDPALGPVAGPAVARAGRGLGAAACSSSRSRRPSMSPARRARRTARAGGRRAAAGRRRSLDDAARPGHGAAAGAGRALAARRSWRAPPPSPRSRPAPTWPGSPPSRTPTCCWSTRPRACSRTPA